MTKPFGSLAPTGLPNTVQYCKKCVISNQTPVSSVETRHSKNDRKKTVRFVDGVCDACRWNEMKRDINWNDREVELRQLLDRHRKNDGTPDVVVPASGGKDSRLVAHLLKYKYNMNPITVTWKPHIYTDIGWINLTSMIDNGFSNILVSLMVVQRKLCQLAFQNLGHPFQPFIAGQRTIGAVPFSTILSSSFMARMLLKG